MCIRGKVKIEPVFECMQTVYGAKVKLIRRQHETVKESQNKRMQCSTLHVALYVAKYYLSGHPI